VKFRALTPKRLVGKAALPKYLVAVQTEAIEVERRQGQADQWLLNLHSRETLSLPLVQLTEEQAAEYE